MKKHSLYILGLLLVGASSLFTSCSDNDSSDASDADRLFMPMFRLTQNINSTTDKYHCDITTNLDKSVLPSGYTAHVNDIMLFWNQVDDAKGYQLRAKVQGTSWDRDEVLDTILTADQFKFIHQDLQYSVGYLYAIRALANIDGCDGPGKMKPEYLTDPDNKHNSKWYGYGDGSHQSDQSRDDSRGQTGALTTGLRYDVPSVFWTEGVTKTSLRVCFNATAEDGYDKTYADFLDAGGSVSDNNWNFDMICIVPSSDNPTLDAVYHTVTDAEKAQGYVEFDGLQSNAAYIVGGMNNNVKRYYDRQYNSIMVRMAGDPGDPIEIKWESDPNDTILHPKTSAASKTRAIYGLNGLEACRIDTILANFMSDNTLAEGQAFYLEGGKTYYMASTVNLTKGFTLATNPADIAAGKGRATVLQGVGYSNQGETAANVNNFNLCRNAQSGAENGVTLAIQPIIFEDVNFRPQYWFNYFDQKGTDQTKENVTICGNYFINMNSQGLSFALNELRIKNCTFQGHVRGFIRFQGPNRQIIEKLNVENCVFYNEGGFDTNGRGYAWLNGANNNNRYSNFFKNVTFRNNTIVDSPRHALISENKATNWPSGTTWNIVVENNTFINFSPRSSNKGHGLMLELGYPPKGSTITFRKNLFVFAGNPKDAGRNYYQKGMVINPTSITYDFSDNYSTVVPAYQKYTASNNTETKTTLIDGMFSHNSFSNTSTGAGYNKGSLNIGGFEETMVKFGDNFNGNESDAVGYQLTAEELFSNPAPLGYVNSDGTFTKDAYSHSTLDGFYINKTERVMNHPIYKKQIGDPRWYTGASWNGTVSAAAAAKHRARVAAAKRRAAAAKSSSVMSSILSWWK